MKMGKIIMIVAFSAFMSGCAITDDVETKLPSLELLSSTVGASSKSEQFKNVLKTYDFSESSKGGDSWGSSFGVFFGQSDHGIQVGFRPPSDATNMPTYSGELPMGLKSGDSIADIVAKLGKPRKTAHDPKVYYEMIFEGVAVYTMWGELFEVWLMPSRTATEEQSSAEQTSTAVDQASRERRDGLAVDHSPRVRACSEITWTYLLALEPPTFVGVSFK